MIRLMESLALRILRRGEPAVDGVVGTRNQAMREEWLERVLRQIPEGCRILDAGAGELAQKRFCGHLNYVSQDFAQYDGTGNGKGFHSGTWDQRKLDIVCDITSIPEATASFDAILCVEVFEHLPQPVLAVKEFARLLKPEGVLILTTPFCCLTHLAPFYFSSGYSRYFFEKVLTENGFEIFDLTPNGNYFEYMAQEMRRLPEMASRYTRNTLRPVEHWALQVVITMLGRFSKADQGSDELLTFGYQIRARKKDVPCKNPVPDHQ